MARWLDAWWEPSPFAPSMAGRRSGLYHPYLPDPLVGRSIELAPEVLALSERVEQSIRELADVPGVDAAQGLARFVFRGEAVASDELQRREVSPQRWGIAEFAERYGMDGRPSLPESAVETAKCVAAYQAGVRELAEADRVTLDLLMHVHDAMVWDNPYERGLRESQNWVGGGTVYHPFEAAYVCPPAEVVHDLMTDVAEYLSRDEHPPLIQAGLAHAQIETVHGGPDGNGRLGRAAIQATMIRRGLMGDLLVPVGAVMLTDGPAYREGMAAYQYDGLPSGSAAQAGVIFWLETFLNAVDMAVAQTRAFATKLHNIQQRWHSALETQDARSPETQRELLDRVSQMLTAQPIVTASYASRVLDVPPGNALQALDVLADKGIVETRSVGRAETPYVAPGLFGAITHRERFLATPGGADQTNPNRPVPARALMANPSASPRGRRPA